MKKLLVGVVSLLLLAACINETTVREVRTCSKVAKVELVMRSYYLSPHSDEYLYVKLTTVSGRHFYNDSSKYGKWEGKNLLETATKMEMGEEYCRTTYEPIK